MPPEKHALLHLRITCFRICLNGRVAGLQEVFRFHCGVRLWKGNPEPFFVSLQLSLVWVFRSIILFFRAFPVFSKLFSMLVTFAVAVFLRFVIEISSHALAIAVPYIFVSFLHARGRIILT